MALGGVTGASCGQLAVLGVRVYIVFPACLPRVPPVPSPLSPLCRTFHELKAHKNRVSCLGVNFTGQALCTGSWDTELAVWA